jgi:steroid delta-isomerase-like uncharacterized protein
MRRGPHATHVLVLSAIAFAAIAGCQPRATTESATDTARLDTNPAVYLRLMDQGFTQGDTAIVDSLVAENAVDHEGMEGGPTGRAGVKWIIAELHTAFPDVRFTINDVAAVDDKVWAYVTITGTHQGEFMGVKATGKQIRIDGFDLVRFEDGRMAEHWGVTDMFSLMQQIGPPPARGAQGR